MKRRLILFDIDGTLLASRGAGRRAIVAAISHFGCETISLDAVRFDGKTDPQIVEELFEVSGVPNASDPDRIDQVLERYVSELERELSRSGHATEVMPGVPDLMDRVDEDAGSVLGLLTGNVRRGATLKLHSADLDPRRFEVGAFGSDHHDRAQLPAIASLRAIPHFGYAPVGAEVVIVGDTPADMTCGKALGARAVGVTTGAYSVEDLESAGASAVFPDLGDVDLVWGSLWS